MATYQAHETAVIDPGCTIGDDTRIWHFSHIMLLSHRKLFWEIT